MIFLIRFAEKKMNNVNEIEKATESDMNKIDKLLIELVNIGRLSEEILDDINMIAYRLIGKEVEQKENQQKASSWEIDSVDYLNGIRNVLIKIFYILTEIEFTSKKLKSEVIRNQLQI